MAHLFNKGAPASAPTAKPFVDLKNLQGGQPAPQIAGPQQVNAGFQVQQNLDPATDPMLAAIGGTVPTAPKLTFTPTQEQADAAWKFQNAPIEAYNAQANEFNKKNYKKIAKGKVDPMPLKQTFAKPVIDPSMSYDISQYNPYDPYGIQNQMMMSMPAATGIDAPKKQSKYAPVNPFTLGTPEYALWSQAYGAPETKKQKTGWDGNFYNPMAPRQYGNEY